MAVQHHLNQYFPFEVIASDPFKGTAQGQYPKKFYLRIVQKVLETVLYTEQGGY